MVKRKVSELLVSFARKNPSLEATKAAAMFQKFVSDRFSYDEISNNPDYPVYASAEVLAVILPLIIDEMLARNDTLNFLIYPILTAIDPSGDGRLSIAERTEELAKIADRATVDKVLKLLSELKRDPPIPVERLDKIIAFWRDRTLPPI